MPTIDDRLREAGAVWREHVDNTTPRQISPPTPNRRRAPKRRAVLAAAVGVVVAAVGIPTAGVLAHRAADHTGSNGGFAASCAAPQLRLAGQQRHSTHAITRAGQVLTVAGRFYTSGCADNNHEPAPHPLQVDVALRGNHDTIRLRTVQAHGELGTFRVTVRIPTDYPPGDAEITTRTTGPQAETAAGVPLQAIRLSVVR